MTSGILLPANRLLLMLQFLPDDGKLVPKEFVETFKEEEEEATRLTEAEVVVDFSSRTTFSFGSCFSELLFLLLLFFLLVDDSVWSLGLAAARAEFAAAITFSTLDSI